MLTKIDPAIKECVDRGLYSVYTIKNTNEHVLFVPGANECCRNSGGCEKWYSAIDEGATLKEITKPDVNNLVAVVNFDVNKIKDGLLSLVV